MSKTKKICAYRCIIAGCSLLIIGACSGVQKNITTLQTTGT